MKRRKLRSYVLPSIYLMSVCIIALGITLFSRIVLSKQIPSSKEHYNYTMSVFDETDKKTLPAQNEIEVEMTKVSKPFTDESVIVEKEFYKEEDSLENQEKSLIYYQNTYMQNTGVLYSSANVFDVIATMDGTVLDVTTDEILGNVVTLQSNNTVCAYYTVSDIQVKKGDKVKQNDIIAKSGQSQIETTKQTLLFEVYVDGVLTNPNTFFEKNISEIN